MQHIHKSRLRILRTWELGPEPAELMASNAKNNSMALIDLASNDYLGLNRHPFLLEAAKSSMISDGVGAGSSRLVTGSRPIHKALEQALGDWLDREYVMLFPSGFQANLAAVIGLTDRYTTVFADRLIHHSLLIGIKASGAKLKRFLHNDVSDLENHLSLYHQQNPQKSPLVITESLFSMEGTSPPIQKISEVCAKYGAKLLVDEAHSLGVMGSQGRGLCYGMSTPIVMISGTFGKAFGSGGAFLATNKVLGEHLLQTSGAFRYTTALAPPLAAAALAALQLIKENPTWSKDLQERSNRWRQKLIQKGWKNPPGNGPILSLIIGSDQKALELQANLEKKGLLCVAIRPPTVPEDTARLRVIVRRSLPAGTLEKLLIALSKQ